MSLPRSVAEVLKSHVTLEVEGIDRMYLNVYQPQLQSERGVALFFRFHRGELFASSALMNPMSKSFIAAVDRFVRQEQIPLITSPRDNARTMSPRSIGRTLASPRELSWLARPRKRHRSSVPRSAAIPKPAKISLDRANHGHGESLLLLRHR